ncbi:unnamed protein product, partial [Adineta ricciae]
RPESGGKEPANIRCYPAVFRDGTCRIVSISDVFRLGSVPVPAAGTLDLVESPLISDSPRTLTVP